MSRRLTVEGEREERLVQAASMRHLLAHHDEWERDAIKQVATRIMRARTRLTPDHPAFLELDRALGVLSQWFERDLRENAMHGEISPEAVLLSGVPA